MQTRTVGSIRVYGGIRLRIRTPFFFVSVAPRRFRCFFAVTDERHELIYARSTQTYGRRVGGVCCDGDASGR